MCWQTRHRLELLLKASAFPVIPGIDHAIGDARTVHEFGREHGYPIILKAAFGGGGRGMRIVHGPEDVQEAFDRASGEAASAFGRPELFCERFVQSAKHIEVQILADHTGHCVHFFERDCSVQRRHQKVIEYAPSVTLRDATRDALYAASGWPTPAITSSAGTVEFLVDAEENMYFIEVNPRIQVEHTVTEVITLSGFGSEPNPGRRWMLDSPEIQINQQDDIQQSGYAIQCRITTEDPAAGFLPDTGKISAYREASGFGIRLDASTGGAGTEITSNYDSMIVKPQPG